MIVFSLLLCLEKEKFIYMNEEFIIKLIAELEQSKSQKQINSDIKQLEKALNMIRFTATLAKGDTKKELNAYIQQLSNQLSTLKLKTKIDSKNLKSEIDSALNDVKFKDIDALNIDENKAKLKVRKVIADAKAYVDKNSISVNIDMKKEKLNNDLTTYLGKYSKINESAVLLEEAEKVRGLINAIDDKKSLRDATDAFQLFKSEVSATGFTSKSTTEKIKGMLSNISKIGSMFGVASLAVNNFVKSLQTLKSNDTILTEISKTSEMTKQQLVELGNEAFKTASKYGQLSSNYLLGVQEMARSGYEETSKELGELSLLAQSAGDMTAENANNYLLATDAAYKYSGSIEKLNVALDGANYISNKNSASLTDIADAISVSASFAANAGIAIDELTAAESTMIATTKRSGSEMGRAFRSIILNLQGVSGEFDGEVIDEEQLKKVEARCHSLGVELEYLKDGVATLRNPMDVLKDLADVYNSLPDNSADKQGLISDLGGKYHANALSSLLSRWDLYEKMLAEYSQGTGSALEEANKTADSWEGRLNSLQNSWDSFVNSLTNKETIMGGISFFEKLIQSAQTLTETIGEIPTLLTAVNTAMVALNKDYGITQVVNKDNEKLDIQGNIFGIDFTAIKNQKKHFEDATVAISDWNCELTNGKTDLDLFYNACVQNNAQLKAYLATCSKEAPASLSGYKNYLNAAGVSTDALRLKTILLNSAISMGVGFAIQAAIQGITYLIQKQEKLRQATEEAASAYQETASSIDDYVSKYQELRQALIAAKGNEEETYNVKKQLLELQTELNDKFGEEYGTLNLVTDAYKDQTEAIKAYNKEVANTYLNENRKGIETATKQMTKERHYNLSYTGVSAFTDEGAALKEIAEKYKDQGITLLDELGDGSYAQFSVHLSADAQSAYETINDFENDLREKAIKLGNEDLFADVLEISSSELNNAKEIIDNYGDIFKEALNAEITTDNNKAKTYAEALQVVEAYNEAVLKSEDPYNDANVTKAKEDLNTIKATIQENEEEWNKYSYLMDDVFDQADTRLLEFNEALQSDDSLQKLADDLEGLSNLDLQSLDENIGENTSFDKLKESADEYDVSVEELIDALVRLGYVQEEITNSTLDIDDTPVTLSISQTIDQLNTQLKPAMDSLSSAWQDIFTDDGFEINSIDILSTCDSIKSTLDEMADPEGLNLDVDYSAFEDFVRVLNNTESTEQNVKDAFNALATSITDAALSGTEDFETMKAALEDLGVVNNELVAFESLISNTKALKEAGLDLATVTNEQINAFASEIVSAENVSQAIAMLTFQKELCGLQDMNTAGEVANLLTLAENAGYTGEVIENLTELEQIYQQVASGTLTPGQLDAKLARAEELQNAIKESASQINYEPKVDFSNATKSASKAGSEAADKYLNAFQEEYNHLKDLLDRGEISVSQYLSRLRSLYMRYFADRKEYLDEFKKYESEYLSGMLDLHNKALSGISTLMNRKISAANDAKDATISALEEEKEAAEDAYQAQIDAIEEEKNAIDELIKEKNKKIDAINDEIDAIERAAETRRKNLDLQQQEYNLQKMLNQKVISVYKGEEGIVFETDTTGIQDAREKVKEAQEALEIDRLKNEADLIQKEVDLLEEKKDALSEQQDALQKMIDESNKYYDNLIKQQEAYWDSMIKGMEQQKSRWEELAEVQEVAEAFSYIQQVFGDLGYTVEDVLNGSDAAFEDFKSRYISLISDVNNNSSFAEGLFYATGVAEENLGSFLNKTQETADGLDVLGEKASELDAVATSMNNASTSASNLSTSTEGINENLTGVSDAINGISTDNTNNITNLAEAFTALGEAIKTVAEALGIGEEIATSGIIDALSSIKEISLGTDEEGIIGQFNRLKTAVDNVTSAISGGTSSNGGNEGASNSSSPSMSDGATEGNSSGLSGAIDTMGETATETLGEADDEEGVISKFNQLKTAVDDVTTAIGIGGEESEGSEENSNTLIGALQAQYEKATEVLPETKTLFEELLVSIESCVSALNNMVSAMNSIQNISMPSMGGNGVAYKGTVGNAFANGTTGFRNLPITGYKGLPHTEKNALRSEYGQPELTVYPNGTTELTTKPTMSDLPKGTVVFNEEQTKKIMNNKSSAKGNAHADGTVDEEWINLDNGMVVRKRPLSTEELIRNLQQKSARAKQVQADQNPDINVQEKVAKSATELGRSINEMLDPMHIVSYNMEKMLAGIDNISNHNNISSIINNENVQQPVTVQIGDINLTGVQDVNGLATAIKTRLPGMMMQGYFKN